MTESEKPISPRWSNSTKLIATLLIVAGVIALLIRFQFMLAPLIFAFILAYLLQPASAWFHRKLNIPWKMGVNLIYLFFVIVIVGLLIWGGLALLDQIQKLIIFLQNTSNSLPTIIQDFLQHPILIGKTVIDLTKIDFLPAAQQILNTVQPLLGNIAKIVGNLATGAANVVVWILFAILISYFILHEAAGRSEALFHLDIPRYKEDVEKIGQQIGSIWNTFLRRQLLIFLLSILIYSLFLGLMGIRYFFGLALMAGLARFVPYIGPWVTWITYGLVANFQDTNIFGISPLGYVVAIVAPAILIDYIIDMYVQPRLMGDALKLHPGAVMVGALVGLNLFGIIGMILASPLLATFKLFFDYSRYKIQDEDPWEHIQSLPKTKPERRILYRIFAFIKNTWNNLREKISYMKLTSKTRKEEKDNARTEGTKNHRNRRDG
jgi:predicted PurR-regulated permease PerM